MVSGLRTTVGPFSKNIAASDSRAVVCQQGSGTFVLALGLGPVLLLPGDAGECDVRSDSGEVRATGTTRLDRLIRASACEVQLAASKRKLRICFGDIGRQSRITEAFRGLVRIRQMVCGAVEVANLQERQCEVYLERGFFDPRLGHTVERQALMPDANRALEVPDPTVLKREARQECRSLLECDLTREGSRFLHVRQAASRFPIPGLDVAQRCEDAELEVGSDVET
jgi:hypothetical protein